MSASVEEIRALGAAKDKAALIRVAEELGFVIDALGERLAVGLAEDAEQRRKTRGIEAAALRQKAAAAKAEADRLMAQAEAIAS